MTKKEVANAFGVTIKALDKWCVFRSMLTHHSGHADPLFR
jgi:uncharacterized membrane protein YhdT